MSQAIKITEAELFQDHEALTEVFVTWCPFSASLQKKCDLWFEGDDYYFIPFSPTYGYKRKYPQIKFIGGRDGCLKYVPNKPCKSTKLLIERGLVKEVRYNSSFIYIWSKPFTELKEILKQL
nr:hypothetical protein 13 [Gammaproteobacteria bacterium]